MTTRRAASPPASWSGLARGPSAHGLVPWASTPSSAPKQRRGCADQVRARRLRVDLCEYYPVMPARKTSPDGPPPLPFPLFADACGGGYRRKEGRGGGAKLPSVQPEVGDVAGVLF
jgi:hypothetical protein